MKKLVTIFLLIIITIQILPLAELGKMIFDKEYVENDYCEEIEKEKKFETEAVFLLALNQTIKIAKKSQNHFPLLTTGFQPHPICDVFTPPPIGA